MGTGQYWGESFPGERPGDVVGSGGQQLLDCQVPGRLGWKGNRVLALLLGLSSNFLPLEQPVGMLTVPEAWEEFGWGRVVSALRSSAPLPPRHQLTLVFVMSAGEGHHVVFLAPSPSFLPQSKFVLLFDLNTYPWLWTRESVRERATAGRCWGPGQLRVLGFLLLHCELPG